MSLTELQVGDTLGTLTLDPITRLELIKYAGASGDYNPIHTIDEEASKAGLSGVIAHGMLTMGRMARLFSPYLEQGFIEQFSTRFTGMVFVGDVITFQAEVKESGETNKVFSVVAKNQKDQIVAKGNITFKIYA
jgi:acyl dehydratase